MRTKTSEKKIFTKFLNERGQRLTRERMIILRRVFSCRGHFDPETLYLQMRRSGLKASRASVYRTLNLLRECGLVERVRKTEQGSVYEYTFGHRHHDHMLCMGCGNMIEFYSADLERLQEELCAKQGFQGKNHSLEIRGYCSKCRKKKK
jgi:Fur family ferric uptake transcriptional regulator